MAQGINGGDARQYSACNHRGVAVQGIMFNVGGTDANNSKSPYQQTIESDVGRRR